MNVGPERSRADRRKAEAEALARAAEQDVASVADVVAWADEVIETEQRPHASVFALVGTNARYAQDLVAALREVPGTADPLAIYGALLHRLAHALHADASRADVVAAALYRLALSNQLLDDELTSMAWSAGEELDLADQGVSPDTRDDVVTAMTQALDDALGRFRDRRP